MYQCGVINCSKPMHCVLSEFRVYVGPRVGAHICLNLGVGLDRILHHTAKCLRVVARLPLAIYICLGGVPHLQYCLQLCTSSCFCDPPTLAFCLLVTLYSSLYISRSIYLFCNYLYANSVYLFALSVCSQFSLY